MRDSESTLQEIKQVVREFVDQRDWQQFHSPKNLSMALAIEAAELMEHFQWIDQASSRKLDPDKLDQVAQELSDVFCYALAIANELDIDLAAAFENKMKLNREKYPAEQYRGRYGADDPNPVKE